MLERPVKITQRPLGLTALAFASIAVALYGLVAGIALLLGGTLGTFAGADAGAAVIVLGAVLFAAGMTSLFVGYGFWTKKHWSWAGGLVVFTVMIVGIAGMGLIGASIQSLLLPIALGAAGIGYLLWPGTRIAILGEPAAKEEPVQAAQVVGAEPTTASTEVAR